MPTQLTIPLKTGLVSGRFEAIETHTGLLALRFAWGTSLGPLGESLDAAFTPIGGGGIGIAPPPGGTGIGVFDPVFKGSLSNIGKGLTNTQPAVAQHLITQAQVHDGMSAMLEGVAVGVLETKKHVARKTAPRVIKEYITTHVKVNLKPLQAQVTAANATAKAAKTEADQLRAHLKKQDARIADLKRHAQPIPLPAPGVELPPWAEIKDRLKNPAKWLGLAALAALIVKALGKMGAGYFRCSNVKHYGKALCGMDRHILDALLGASALIVSSISIVDFARFMVETEKWAAGDLTKGIREIRDIKPLSFSGYSGNL